MRQSLSSQTSLVVAQFLSTSMMTVLLLTSTPSALSQGIVAAVFSQYLVLEFAETLNWPHTLTTRSAIAYRMKNNLTKWGCPE